MKKQFNNIAKNVIDLEIKGLKKLKRFINASFNKAVDAISNCQSKVIFGGVGKSGIGRVHGKEGLRSFSKIKSLLENRFSLGSELWWYHKKDLYIKLVKKFIKFYYK